VWREIPRKWALIKAHAGLIVLLGILQVVSSAVLIFGLNFTTAVNGSLINAAQPALTAIPAWFLVRDRLSPGQGLGILFAFVGVAFMITRGDLAVLTQLSFNNGDLLAVIAVAGWSSYVPLLHRLPREIGLTTSLFLILFSGSLCLIPAYVIEALYFRPMPFTAFSVTVVVTLGIIISAFSVLLWNASVRAVGPNRAVIFLNLIPVFGVVMAIGFLDERLFSFHLIGAGFVAFGIALVVLKARWRRGGEKT
jgi:drug/metabolite transporter (DMT)-like permease